MPRVREAQHPVNVVAVETWQKLSYLEGDIFPWQAQVNDQDTSLQTRLVVLNTVRF